MNEAKKKNLAEVPHDDCSVGKPEDYRSAFVREFCAFLNP